MNWERILALIWKEFLMVLRDARSRTTIFLPPLVQLLIFAFAATLDVKNVPIGILNLDKGEKSFELVQRFYGSKIFTHVVFLQKVEDVAPFMDHQKGVMIVFIEQEFSRNFDAAKEANIQLILDGRRSNTAQILMGYANTIINQFSREYMARIGVIENNMALVPRYWFNPNIIYYWFNIASLVALLTMLSCLVVTSQSVARERELGTFDQLLVSPLMPIEILIGKIIPGILIGVIEGLVMWGIGVSLLQVPFTGSFVLFLSSLLLFSCSVSGFGLFISSLSMTQQQALLGIFVFMLPSVLLSGFATPIENMPSWLQPITYAIPLRYMLVISKGLFFKAMSAKIVWHNLWPMGIICMVTLVGASVCFRRRLQ
ncbi:MAG: ABC transporter permease [Parachlamydiales bacterium]|nr:ABC transporter permease [Parachlamydiales bacterium]